MAKTHDLVVKVGEYTNNQGETKSRYENIGAVMSGKDDGSYIMLKRTFNPAGVPGNADRDSILVSMFEPQNRSQQPAQSSNQARPAQDLNDDIPF